MVVFKFVGACIKIFVFISEIDFKPSFQIFLNPAEITFLSSYEDFILLYEAFDINGRLLYLIDRRYISAAISINHHRLPAIELIYISKSYLQLVLFLLPYKLHKGFCHIILCIF